MFSRILLSPKQATLILNTSKFATPLIASYTTQPTVEEDTHEHDCDLRDKNERYRVPKIDHARRQPRKFRECDNEALYVMAVEGEYGARRERLVREIMRVDKVNWVTARLKVENEVNALNDKHAFLVRLPYKIGVTCGLVASLTSIPLVFHRDTAIWFNDRFVHEDLPDDGLADLDTFWRVGSWTWNWMEPYLGTASFVLLGLQFTRMHMQRLHWKPYTERILSWRANRLAASFPEYDRAIVREFSKADPWHE